MVWTKEKPTAEGWYWTRTPGGTVLVVNVFEGHAGLGVEYPAIRYDHIPGDSEWAGPANPPPEES